MDLQRLSECSEYFRALSQSNMKETSDGLIRLDHVSSSVFHNLLEFSFNHDFQVPQEELGAHIQVIMSLCSIKTFALFWHTFVNSFFVFIKPKVSSYLLAEAFLLKCLSALEEELNPSNCLSYLSLAQEIFCIELKNTVFTYLSRNLLELQHVMRCVQFQCCGSRNAAFRH